MKANQNQISKLLSVANTQFTIPVYQRNYNWEEKQCSTLINDIIDISMDTNGNTHFIGSIVYMSDGVHSIGKNDFSVIDGQQRLTSITLLLIAIYHRANDFKEERIRDMVLERYLTDKYLDDANKMKLILPGVNCKILKYLLDRDIIWVEDTQKDSNLLKNYKFFYESIEDINKLKIIISGIEKLLYVDIILEKGKDDPQRIFESLNSTGLDLSQSDLIRNFILMDLDREKQNEIYEDYWVEIENNTKTYKKKKLNILLSEFLRDYLTIELKKIPNQKKVFEEFKNNYDYKDYDLIIEKIKDIKKYSDIYNKILNPEKEEDLDISINLRYLKAMDLGVINPFLMSIYNDYIKEKFEKDTFIKILELLQSYLLRRYVCGEPTGALNKIFASLYNRIDKNNYYSSLESILVNQNFPKNEEFKSSLKTKALYKDGDKLNYIFDRLENFEHNERVDVFADNITIEHIFPQKPNKDWKEALSQSEFDDMLALKDTISNLTLTGSNSNLGNKYFTEKRDKPNLGYKDSKLFLNKWIGEQDKWNINKMNERFEILYSKIVKIWNRPSIDEKPLNEIIFYCKGPRGEGNGVLLNGNKFKILKGSQISKDLMDSVKQSNTNIINELLDSGKLDEKEEYYVLKDDYIATSPSTASRIILGRSSNGLTDWKTYGGQELGSLKNKE